MVASIIKRLIWLMNISLSIILTYYWLHQMKLRQENDIQNLSNQLFDIQMHYRTFFNVDCWQKACAILAIYLLVHYYLKSILLTIHEAVTWPASQKIIKCLGFIIRNSILYILILGFSVAYVLIQNYQAILENQKFQSNFPILDILEMFIVGRLIFSFGFLFGTITGFEDFRSMGMGLTMGAIVVALAQVNHINLLSYF